jgi:hypothetical protein
VEYLVELTGELVIPAHVVVSGNNGCEPDANTNPTTPSTRRYIPASDPFGLRDCVAARTRPPVLPSLHKNGKEGSTVRVRQRA